MLSGVPAELAMLSFRDRLWRYRYILFWGIGGPIALAQAAYLISTGVRWFDLVGSGVLALAAGFLLAAWLKRVDERRR